MKSKEKLTKILKCRVPALEYEVVKQEAQKQNISMSEVQRKHLFDKHSSLYISVHRDIVKQQIYNKLISTKMPVTLRQTMIEELNKID